MIRLLRRLATQNKMHTHTQASHKALKLLERRGFDVYLVENLKGYVVKLPWYSRYAPVLKNSVALIETPEWRIFLIHE